MDKKTDEPVRWKKIFERYGIIGLFFAAIHYECFTINCMCIDKKLLLTFLIFTTFSLVGMAQSLQDMPSFENQEIKVRNLIEIYPNPTTDFIHVEIKESEFNSVGFEMYNIIGNTIKVSYEQVRKDLYKIPVKDLASGYYMLIVKDDETRYRKAFKFMKN